MQKAFERLGEKILLTEDIKKLTILNNLKLKTLVSYYQIITENDGSEKSNSIIYNIYFDKDKIHNLFFNLGIFYSEITNKEFYLLPILKKMINYSYIIKIIFTRIGIQIIKMKL